LRSIDYSGYLLIFYKIKSKPFPAKQNNMADEIVCKLCSSAKLDRDRGYQDILRYVHTLDEEGIDKLEQKFVNLLTDSTLNWESKHGALMGAKALLTNGNTSDDFELDIRGKATELLDDSEFRVRIASGMLYIYLFLIFSYSNLKSYQNWQRAKIHWCTRRVL